MELRHIRVRGCTGFLRGFLGVFSGRKSRSLREPDLYEMRYLKIVFLGLRSVPEPNRVIYDELVQ